MNTTEITYLLNKPNAINDKHTFGLERIVEEFPYFQSARALYLKGLYNQDSFKYNQALRVTASYTTDRSVLFDFITTGNFATLQKTFLDEKEAMINNIIVNESEIIVRDESQKTEEPVVEKATESINKLEQSILTSIKEASPEVELENEIQEETQHEASKLELIEEKLEIGKPLGFSKEEKHSFQEWLQLASFSPINREIAPVEEKTEEKDLEKKKKLEIIDKFIEANPKIPPIKQTETKPIVLQQTEGDTSYLMTETLAKVYLEQKKYQKAIQAYEILILKYPEKSSLFADRISDIKFIQQNNN
ncbi:tetratricopeptide (TPR) repeat protein [Flavobacterium arsenatis]|uniref:Tetratricopeptide (TPR) repeat protein n=1 Tax=Flavobacterium arsenatis TaxID=1484332 RepID=A0ABU1TK40_9FLAO|nr:tetratricopeptide repeat protein [Flavobacterium arsenatis]MDR6966228.1 tetratricopeptide (TPR) repeat protein [Flavobacterium arsenatis]